ncbi:hypothetical protein CFC21_026511 [Triticum aestivum]|uniref:Uncharacterized protein n=2 Tax=Triticum aestivum TaxID=4565 RepID=A0A9R1ELC8_WHEAT|nr:probable ubiquitin-conjugating enzyme E2 23 [Triticum aestivum]KAF7012304.1 hypothetical protein CFC21_026511 [Triticum aestivum]
MAAAASHDVDLGDLVSFGRTLLHHGLVIADADHDSADVDTFKLLLADNTVVYKNAGDLRVVDRSHLRPGEVVGSVSDDDGQLGIVTGITTVLDLAKHDAVTHVITGVSPSTLRRVRSFNLCDFVVSGPWLGQVVEVSIDVHVLFNDGAVCRVSNADSKKLQLVDDTGAGSNTMYRHQMNTLFNPGEHVTAPDPCSVFKAARWLNGSWNPDHQIGTVSKVEMSGVLVYWIASMHHGTDKGLVKASAPSAYQNPDDLTFFCATSNCRWGVADRCFFRKDNAAHDECETPTAQAKVEIPMVVANTRTSVDVLWQDGTRQHGISSTTVIPFQVVDEDLFPGDHVVGVLPIDASVNNYVFADGTEFKRPVGVIRSLHYEDRTACVSWFNEAREVECEDTVTVYALKKDSSYLPVDYGDIVIRLLPSGSTSGEIAPLLQGNKKKSVVAADLSWVGHVVDLLNDGHVQVKWGDGSMSMVLPHEIVVVEEVHYSDLLDEMDNWVVVDNIVDAPEELATANTDHDLGNPTDDSGVEGDHPAMKRISLLGLATQSLLQMTDGVVARCKGYMPLSSSTSSELPVPTYDESTSGDTAETIDAAMTRNIVDVNGHDLAEEGAKADN